MSTKYKNIERVKPSGLELVDHHVGVQRVTKVTKGGRAFGFSAIVVVGDENPELEKIVQQNVTKALLPSVAPPVAAAAAAGGARKKKHRTRSRKKKRR